MPAAIRGRDARAQVPVPAAAPAARAARPPAPAKTRTAAAPARQPRSPAKKAPGPSKTARPPAPDRTPPAPGRRPSAAKRPRPAPATPAAPAAPASPAAATTTDTIDAERRPPGSPPKSRRRRLIEDGILVALAIAIAVLVRSFAAQAYYIPSASMEPLLHINDRVVVSRMAYHLHPVHRGDVVVFKSPPGVEPANSVPSNPLERAFRDVGVALGFTQDQTVLIKRVIGLPGDMVQGKNGHVYVDGRLLVEPYLPAGTITSTFDPVRIPHGDVWVMGDNRGNSEDSRIFGPIPVSTIVGRAIWRVWPPWRPAFL